MRLLQPALGREAQVVRIITRDSVVLQLKSGNTTKTTVITIDYTQSGELVIEIKPP